jgi:exo-1,4-beta-D-glucosaminidase
MFQKRVFAPLLAALALAALLAGACQSQGSNNGGGAGAPSTGAAVGTNGGSAGGCSASNCQTASGGNTPSAGSGGANQAQAGGAGSGGSTACSECTAGRVFLRSGWSLQASGKVGGSTGAQISVPGFATSSWYGITVPTTVFAGLVANNVYPDPFIGENLSQAPASIADGSWWYRTEFTPSADFTGEAVFLALDGINYKANVWLNGQQIAKSDDVVGTFTNYEFNISSLVHVGMPNALALEIFPPDLTNDLALTWLDWNPGPPDRNMGIWHEVYLRKSAAVAVRNTHATSQVDPSLTSAALTLKADVVNTSAMPVHATVTAKIEQISVSQDVDLAANETKTVSFDASTNPTLKIASPRLW